MASVAGGRGHRGGGAPARAGVVAGAGLGLALVVGAAGPALADRGSDPGGSGTASVGGTLRLAGLPGGGSFDPLRLDQVPSGVTDPPVRGSWIALDPENTFAGRKVDHIIPFTLTNPTTGSTGSFGVRVVQPFSYDGEQVRIDQPPQVRITKDPNWPWPGVKIRPGDQSQEVLPLTDDHPTVFPFFLIDNNTSRTLKLGSPGGSTTIPAWSTTLWHTPTTIFRNGASSTGNDLGGFWKTNPDGSTSQGSSWQPRDTEFSVPGWR